MIATPIEAAFLALILASLCHLVLFTLLAHTRRDPPPSSGATPFVVFVIPCLDEELVIGRTLDKLLALPRDDFAILVVDDASRDRTVEVVASYDPARVWLLRRRPPEARVGKGAALNHAYRHLQESDLLADRYPHEVVVAVLDADGRLRPDALDVVLPLFRRPLVGAVQIGVRMYNARESLLTRMQDMEFVVFTEIFQRARRHLGSVGLGGNGQFVRLAAFHPLGGTPWTDCLTEDLDLGIRLRLAGWMSEYTGATWVEQQAVNSLRRLVRQRARWFRGHLQCTRHVPLILRAGMPLHTALDLCWHLLGPVTILLMSVWSATFLTTLAYVWITDPAGSWRTITESWWIMPVFYALSMAPALLYGTVYGRAAPARGAVGGRRRPWDRIAALVLAHAFTVYGYLWFVAGWQAVAQMLRGRHGWTKTTRTAEPAVPTAP